MNWKKEGSRNFEEIIDYPETRLLSVGTQYWRTLLENHPIIDVLDDDFFTEHGIVTDNYQVNMETTLYIHHMNEKRGNLRSIIFDKHKGILLCKYTTTNFVNRLINEKILTFVAMRAIGSLVEKKQALPYTCGMYQLFPDSGPSKRGASWTAGHHLANISDVESGTDLFFNNGLRIRVQSNYAQFLKQLNLAHLFTDIQDSLASKVAAELGYETPIPQFRYHDAILSLVQNRCDTYVDKIDFIKEVKRLLAVYTLKGYSDEAPDDSVIKQTCSWTHTNRGILHY
ncbi:hypothetical protein ACVQ8P_07690 [Dellaglioa sp. BT-FLS60]